MKKNYLVLFAFAAMSMLAGCGDSPKDVVKAANGGGKEPIKQYYTEQFLKKNEAVVRSIEATMEFNKNLPELLKNGKEEINGDEAIISFEVKGHRMAYRLKKVDGKWKIYKIQ